MKNTVKVALVAVASMLVVGGAAGYALAGHSSPRTTLGAAALPPGSYKIKTSLGTGLEVPKPKGTKTATGTLSGTLKVTSATKATLTFKLTYARLTGPGLAAHIHLGAPGKSGKIVVPLCAPCTSGAHGTKNVPAAGIQAMVGGRAYVNVHTKLNPAGEIRGNIKAAAPSVGGGGGGDNPYASIVVTPTAALVAKGKSLSTQFSCEGCHTIDGTQSSGPTWKGLAGRNVKLTNGKTVKATDGYLIWSIEQPDAEIVAGYSSGIMTTAIGNISVAQSKALVAYIKSVK